MFSDSLARHGHCAYRVICVAAVLISAALPVRAQQTDSLNIPPPVQADTSGPVEPARRDTAAPDQATPRAFPSLFDTTVRALPPAEAVLPDTSGVRGVDTIITYSASDSIVFMLPRREMSLYSRSRLNFRVMALESERIDVNWKTATLTAEGVADTSDSSGGGYRGTPVMREAGEKYSGHRLSYNFRTKKGKIDLGDTRIEEGFYHGETIKKIDEDDLFVRDGRYTTCDLPEPHYYFGSPRMKVTVRDKVIAEPIYLYIADVPVFGLPFAVLPNRAGRRSGIITPAFGEDGRRGKFLSHLGFYWATSDYMDLSMTGDIFTKGGWALYSDYRYNLRYNFSGSVSGDYKRLFTGEEGDPKRTEENSYRLNMTHNQEFDPTTRFNANFTFTSNNSYVNTINLAQALNQNIVSNATLSKRWEGTPNSVSVNVGRTQDLRNGNVTEILPSVNFNHSQSFPFRSSSSSAGSLSWYENLGLGYSANFSNRLSASDRTLAGVWNNVNGMDVLDTLTARERDRTRTLNQSLSLNFAPKLGHVTISPSVSYRDQRTFVDNDVPLRDETDSSFSIVKQTSTQKSGVLTASLSAGTKLYGMLQPNMLGVSALRHTLSPSLAFSYSKPLLGEKGGKESMSMRFNVGNIFEIKTTAPDTGEPAKIQLLNLSAGLSYNFSADSLRLSPMTVSFRTGIKNIVDIDGGATYDFYKLVETGPGQFVRVNRYLLSEQGRLARLTNFRLSLSTRLAGEQGGDGPTAARTGAGQLPVSPGRGFSPRPEDFEPNFSIPWSLSLSLDYRESKVQPRPSRSMNLRGNLEFSLTEKWKVTMSGGYDVTGKETVAPDITISRDLHCWFMNFYWVPTGAYKQYRFEIRVKASQLKDLKLTKQGSDRGFLQ